MSLNASITSHAFPTDGIKLSFLDEVIARFGGHVALQGKTTDEVCKEFVYSVTKDLNKSYCDLLKSTDGAMVGKAEVFVSHAWACLFLDVVAVLKGHFQTNPEVFIWFDVFSKDQHDRNTPVGDVFKSAVKDIGHTVVVLTSLTNPLPLTRTWCIWEIFCTMDTNSRLDVAVDKESLAMYLNAHDFADVYQQMDSNFTAIDAAHSIAGSPADKARIDDEIRRTVGFHEVNSRIGGMMVHWMKEVIGAEILVASSEVAVKLKFRLGLLYRQIGNVEASHGLLYDAWNAVQGGMLGPTSFAFLLTMVQYAESCTITGNYFIGDDLYASCLDCLGDGSDESLLSIWLIAKAGLARSLNMQNKELHIAQFHFEECLQKRPLRVDDTKSLITAGELAVVYGKKGHFNRATALFHDCLNALMASRNPNALEIAKVKHFQALYSNTSTPRFSQQLELTAIAYFNANRAQWGSQHSETMRCMKSVNLLFLKHGRFESAQKFMKACYEKLHAQTFIKPGAEEIYQYELSRVMTASNHTH